MKIEKKQFIRDLKKGMNVNDIFVVKSKSEILKYSGGYRFEMLLSDKTGDIYAKYWGGNDFDKVKAVWEKIKVDDVIYIEGRVSVWNDMLEIALNENSEIRVLSPDEFYKKDFIEVSETVEKDFEEFMAFIRSIDNDILRNLLLKIFTNAQIVSEFKRAPASYYEHYSYAGGLLKHTINVAKLCEFVAKIHENVDRNLLITGALLHDIGRIKEFKVGTTLKPTKLSYFETHEVIGIRILEDFYRDLKIPNDIQLRLNHIILTHHGKYEPIIPEAYIVKYCNDLDTNVSMILGLKKLKKDVVEFEIEKQFHKVYFG